MPAQSGPIVAKLLVTVLVHGLALQGCALLIPDHSPLSDAEWLAVPLWFGPAAPTTATTVPMPPIYATAPVFAVQAPLSNTPATHAQENAVAASPPPTELTGMAFAEAWLGIQGRLDAMQSTLRPRGSTASPYSTQRGVLPPDMSRASQYRKDLIARERLKGLAIGPADGERHDPATFWINHAPGAYSPALRFRAPLNFVHH